MTIQFNHIRLLLFALLCFTSALRASHYRAGEITYEQISGELYRVIVTTYTDPSSQANQFTINIPLDWGDGSPIQTVDRTSLTMLAGGTTQENVYIAQHAYSSDGVYRVSITDPNRVANIVNINGGINTDGVAFYLESVIRINSFIGNNQSPKLTVKPILDGCLQFFYMHNPGAYDPDGDSLVYSLGVPKDAGGKPVPNYSTPFASDSFSINPRTGSVYWVLPTGTGLYNILIRITEYRNGKVVGYVERDMQVRIRDCVNAPPTIPIVSNYCVQAGDTVKFIVSSTDANIQTVTIRGYGGPFSIPIKPATLDPNPGQGVSLATTSFVWKTACNHIRYRAHTGTIEAIDNYFDNPMATYATFDIKVVGPKPTNLQLKQRGSGFILSWNRDTCQLANVYKIYRKIDSSFYTNQSCVTGMPSNLGFQQIGTISGNINSQTDTFFYDNNNGEGLSPLVNYCYRIVAVFPPRRDNGVVIGGDPSESYVSNQTCGAIILSKPILTKVSVRNTSSTLGSIQLNWIRPDTLDTTYYVAPYRVVCKRAILTNGTAGVYTAFKTFAYPAFYLINDTFTVDTNLNTQNNQYVYRIELQFDSAGIFSFADESPLASSEFLSVYATDNANILSWSEKVPWLNESYTLYRKNSVSGLFDSITTTAQKNYIDTGLVNGTPYTYLLRSYGRYSFFNDSILNFSQQITGIPIDTVKPCSPIPTVTTPCDITGVFTTKLNWIPRSSCAKDVVSYNIYYKKFVTDNYTLLASFDAQTFQYIDTRDTLKFSIAGCYAVTGVDSFNNESLFDNAICVDNCPYYEIPNVFTPGSDGKNDMLHPFPYRFIDKIELKIYNRWGQIVFETNNLDINWDGKDKDSGTDCAEGTYYYTLNVYEQYLSELKTNKKRGTLKLMR